MADENTKKQLKRKFISLEEKIQILNRLKDGERVSSVAKSLNLNEATIRTVKRNENKIRTSVAEGRSFAAKRVARVRDVNMIKMENALMVWLEDCTDKRIPLSGNIIRQKALKIYEYLKETGNCSAEQSNQSFTASKGWFEKLKTRFSLHNIKFQGERALADPEAAHKFAQELRDIVDREEYTAEQIFNANEIALYWKKMPSRTYITQNERLTPGFGVFTDRITLLMCSNVSGNFLLKPAIICPSSNPRIMKNNDISQLPIFWRSNDKAWMTRTIFEDWFNNCFVPSVESYMKDKNLSFKILLLVDNATGHNKELNHPNVKILLFPPNSTSIIQPQGQGIIRAFKAYYVRKTFETLLTKLENAENKTFIEIWKEFSILDRINIVSSACNELKPSTLNAGWKVLLPEMVQKDSAIPSIEAEYNRIVDVASRLDGEGLADMRTQDVEGLFQEQALSEKELIELVDKRIFNASTDSDEVY